MSSSRCFSVQNTLEIIENMIIVISTKFGTLIDMVLVTERTLISSKPRSFNWDSIQDTECHSPEPKA